MRIVVVEHLVTAKKLAPLLIARWPGEQIVLMLLMQGYLNRPVYPRDLAYKDFPLIHPVEFKPVEKNPDGYFNYLCIVRADGTVSVESQSFEDARRTMEGCTSLAYMGDWDYTGVWGMELLKKNLIPGKVIDHEVYRFEPDYKDDDYHLVIPTPMNNQDPDYLALYQAAWVKRYFEFNFYLNSHAIFGKLFREVFGSTADYIGRNAIQTSIRMGQEGGLPWALPAYLQSWKGTGRYSADNPFYKGMGSYLSCWNVSHQLLRLKIAERGSDEGKRVKLTPEGASFVSKIHKDCYDQDLPFRLGEWMTRPLSEVQPIIDRYILTYFRKQKRLQDA
jgi:hypothetical protein